MKKTATIRSDRQSGGPVTPWLEIPEAMGEFFARLPAVVYRCGPPPSYPTTFVSNNVYAQSGYRPEEFYANPFFWSERLHENDKFRVLSKIAALETESSLTYEYRFRRSDGEYTWLHDQVSVLRDHHFQIVGLVGSWFDITDRKRLESLQEGQSRVLEYLVQRRSLDESLEQIVRLIEVQCEDMVCSILRFDSATQRLHHGAAPSLPDDYNRQVDGLQIGPVAGSCGTAAYLRQRVVVTDIQFDPLWADYREVAAKHDLRACWSQPILSSSDQLLGTFAMYYRQSRGPTQGELHLIEQAARLAAIAFERYRDEELMRQTERLASLGTFAAGIAHEINNPIGGIRLAAQALDAALAKGNAERVRSMLDIITTETERCAKIIRGVLQFGRRNEIRKQPASLNRIVKAACELTQGYATEHGATVELSLATTDAEILGCVVELEQVFVNLLRNGIESQDHGARVTVQIGLDRDFARVAVRDDGQGMSDEQKARIFDPFFTTRQSEGGTGLGMSIVHGIVAGHGGTIHIDSKPQLGTAVVVSLPRHE